MRPVHLETLASLRFADLEPSQVLCRFYARIGFLGAIAVLVLQCREPRPQASTNYRQ